MIQGIDIELILRQEIGKDALGEPIYAENGVEIVPNVLVAPASDQEVTEAYNLYGAKAVYTLGIPKTDTHSWKDAKVRFFGQTWHTIGEPTKGIEAMIPLAWNMKVRVETYHENGK